MSSLHTQAVLRGAVPRAYGGGRGGGGGRSQEVAAAEEVAAGSDYLCIAPSPLYDKLLRLRKPLGC